MQDEVILSMDGAPLMGGPAAPLVPELQHQLSFDGGAAGGPGMGF